MGCMASQFLPIEPLATLLGVPLTYLRREADEGHLPYLLAGRRRLFSVERIRQILEDRADAAAKVVNE
jgi:excisionase family DNA binding protein